MNASTNKGVAHGDKQDRGGNLQSRLPGPDWKTIPEDIRYIAPKAADHEPKILGSVLRSLEMLATESYRPSIISPAPGRYVNVGTDRCLCSCSSLLGARTCSYGRLNCAPQPMSASSTPEKMADLTRIILRPVCSYGLLGRKRRHIPL